MSPYYYNCYYYYHYLLNDTKHSHKVEGSLEQQDANVLCSGGNIKVVCGGIGCDPLLGSWQLVIDCNVNLKSNSLILFWIAASHTTIHKDIRKLQKASQSAYA